MSDYGHHPTEIKLTLEAIKNKYFDKKLFVVFQPHQYSRTIELLE
jgi:UDP-N-acetylmuramate--alanine ligase